MLYYLGELLRESFTPFNVLTYNTVRAGGAAITAFIIALLIGPAVIRWLQALKVGQVIRKDHVEDLHELHKKKAGTPTMGGALILLAMVASLALWGRFTNRLLWVALLTVVALGLVGFIDDYIKLRRKHNKGLSARAKFTGQILVGVLLGVYLVAAPVTPGRTRLDNTDVLSWPGLANVIDHDFNEPAAVRDLFDDVPTPAFPEANERRVMVDALNRLLNEVDLAEVIGSKDLPLSEEGRALLKRYPEGLDAEGMQRLNRLLLEARYPQVFAQSIPDLHTKVELPGFKNIFIPLGAGYALFVLLIIVGSSNAVNLTDGLDGLAIGASIVALIAYTAIAYIISRADWSRYLFLVYVPEATELAVFGAALLGAGMGFLWFNCHPAEVFMGDTGSLALGGAIGTMAILTKQELLLLVVGGVFVMEAGSVILQVASFKTRGKRIFRMAPLHHHFELKGWSETKVVIRFWILAIVFAMLSLSALKLR